MIPTIFSSSLIFFPEIQSYFSFPMFISGAALLQGERVSSQHMIIGLGVLAHEEEISNTTSRAGKEKCAEQLTRAKHFTYTM